MMAELFVGVISAVAIELTPLDNEMPTYHRRCSTSQLQTDLTRLKGVLIQQVTQKSEILAQTLSLPYETNSEYKISALPEEVEIAQSNRRGNNIW